MIPNKKITMSDYNRMINYQKINFGGEATICESDNPYTVYKIFNKCGKPISMSKNKKKKLEILYNLKPENSTEIISTISLYDMIIGYEMINESDFDSFKLYQLNRDELLYFLNHLAIFRAIT